MMLSYVQMQEPCLVFLLLNTWSSEMIYIYMNLHEKTFPFTKYMEMLLIEPNICQSINK